MEQQIRPGNFFIIFMIMQYLPYIVISLLVVAVAIWVVFGAKKFRWAKILAIVLTVIVVIAGLLSVTPFILRGVLGRNLPQNRPQFRQQQSSVYPGNYENIVTSHWTDNVVEVKI